MEKKECKSITILSTMSFQLVSNVVNLTFMQLDFLEHDSKKTKQ